VIVTEAALREQLRHPRHGATVHVPAGAVLSPSARDFVGQWDLLLEEDGHASTAAPPTGAPPTGARPAWDTPSAFTFDPDAGTTCITCGTPVEHKPEHVTQLDACHMAPKSHPRIRLRSALDTLQATVLLAAHRARDAEAEETATRLDSLAAYIRELLAAEYQERPAAPLTLDGLDDAALRAATHDPRGTLGVDHLTPASTDPDILLWCNLVRASSRDVEVLAVTTYPNPHDPVGASLVHGLNRFSSAAYWVALAHAAADREGVPA
jgi:ethanolamine utilization cobalamin adenosyltransferase